METGPRPGYLGTARRKGRKRIKLCLKATAPHPDSTGLLAAAEAGETIAILRRGRVIARLVPDAPLMAAEVFRPLWEAADEIDLLAPEDAPPEPVKAL